MQCDSIFAVSTYQSNSSCTFYLLVCQDSKETEVDKEIAGNHYGDAYTDRKRYGPLNKERQGS